MPGAKRLISERNLEWEGCFNARDLGRLRTAAGSETRWGAVVRSDSPDRLTAAGWAALHAHGVRTLVDLRNEEERESRLEPAPPDITTSLVPLDDIADADFWNHCWDNDLDGSPLYYQPFMVRKPERCAAAVRAVARARPGGVLIHCGAGRDRTGLVSMLLLALAGVDPQDIASDYELSTLRLEALYAEMGEEDQGPQIEAILRRKKTSARAAILSLLESLEIATYLGSAGLEEDDLEAVRSRLVE
jgi:protein-tyrosine phosphatase